MKFLQLYVWFLCSCFAFGQPGDVWSLSADWSDSSNPNVVSSPRNGTWFYLSDTGMFLEYCTRTAGNGLPGWVLDCPTPPAVPAAPSLFKGAWGASQTDPDDVQGHGPWAVRWVCPVDGTIQISGHMWQFFEPTRIMRWSLWQNGQQFSYGDMTAVGVGGSKVLFDFENGSAGSGALQRNVQSGDSIELRAEAAPGSTTTFVGVDFVIEQIPLVSNIPGDLNGDDTVNLDDLMLWVQWWLENNCDDPGSYWCFGADIDNTGKVDLGDFGIMAANWLAVFQQLHNLGFVVVSPNGPTDGSDFGLFTPGTQTYGLQEAVNYADANGKDVYIVGGGASGGNPPVIYFMNAPLNIPPGENRRIIGGDYVMNFNYTSGDCVVIDSQINCDFRFSLIVAPNHTTGSLVKIAPTSPAPNGQTAFEHCTVDLTASVGGGDVFGGGVNGGIGLHLNASSGPIRHNDIFLREPIACETALWLEAGDISNNNFECPFTHIDNNLILLNTGSYNMINAFVDPAGDASSLGLNIVSGHHNTCHLKFASGFDPGNGLILGADAYDNLVYVSGGEIGYITNNSTVSTNRIISTSPVGFSISQPSVPMSNIYEENRTCFTVAVTIKSAGSVTSWTLMDTNGTSQLVNAGLYPGQLIYLEPGEKIKFNYSATAPTWNWRALR